MGAFLAGLAWLALLLVVVVQLVFDRIVLSLPTAHLLGWGPALVGVLVPLEVAFDLVIALFASLLTIFAVRDNHRSPSGRRIGA